VGKQTFFRSPQISNSWAHSAIANPQISQVYQSANPNPQIFMTNPHLLASTQIFTNTAQLCLKTVLKVVFLKRFDFFNFWALT
jgi:hypothetical protein